MTIANPHMRPDDPEVLRGMALRRKACFASLTVAGILIIAKMAAYMITDSVTLMTSLLDSTFDAVASSITLLSVLHAATPADEEHRFGHGKVEALAAMAQAVFILGSAAYLFFESVHRFIHPQKVERLEIGMAVMLLSIIMTLGLVLFQRYVIHRTHSVAITADHLHYKGDLLMNTGVLAALGIGHYADWPYFDPLFAAAVSISLLYSAWEISRESYGILMDEELPVADRARIEQLVRAHPATRDIHDLRTRHSGQQDFIEFHLELDGGMTLTAAHDVTEEIEMMIYRAFPKAEVMIHQEPAGIDDHRLDHKISAPKPC